MLKKLNNKKGFTLMEMLIVVAIIAVLVAIAIPVFNGALTKSKEAADVANIRAAYAEWQVKMLTENEAVPTDKTALMTSDGTETKLNYNDKLTYTPAQDNKSATIVYKATKLTNPATNDGTYTWKLGTATIN